MRLPAPRPQSLLGVIGYVALATAVFGLGPALVDPSRRGAAYIVEGLSKGAAFGSVIVAFDFFRLPDAQRLAPVHAIGLGLFNLALLASAVATRGAPIPSRWILWACGGALLASPALYLISAGGLQLWRQARSTSSKSDGT